LARRLARIKRAARRKRRNRNKQLWNQLSEDEKNRIRDLWKKRTKR